MANLAESYETDFQDGHVDELWENSGRFLNASSKALVAAPSKRLRANVFRMPFAEMTLEASIALDNGTHGGSAGLIIHATEIKQAVYFGYYVAINPAGFVVFSRLDWDGLKELVRAPLGTPWRGFHYMRVQAFEDDLRVFVDDLKRPKIALKDWSYAVGYSGVFVNQTGATFRKFSALSTMSVN
ncbi:hypothetical protein CDD83_4890 [Cordyceps sp. RAO-2017]|nr:hypothetical protein CDD83_4890 [Cordyceps sp. RAO-2017]